MTEQLDAEELMHLALRAMDQDKNEDAIGYLKRAIVQAPQDGRLHFLLGAVHAELGLDERAINELSMAVQLAPELHTAHFQLGTLLLKRGDLPRAVEAWRPLDQLERQHPLYLFKSALIKLGEGRYADCVAELREGIGRNDENEFLNVEMRQVLVKVEQLMADEGATAAGVTPSAAAPAPAAAADTPHVLLAGYQQPYDGR